MEIAIGNESSTKRNKVGRRVIPAIIDYIRHPNQVMQLLNLSGCMFEDIGIIRLCEGLVGNVSLFSLNLSQNEMSSTGVQSLAQSLEGTNITELDISSNPIGNVGVDILCSHYLQ